MNSDNIEGEVSVTPIDSTNETKSISMNRDFNVVHTYYAPFLLSNNQEGVS